MFDLFKVPIFGHAEDAADNFAGYIMLQFGKERARRLIAGGAWAWRMYVADYRTNPIVQTQLAGFASNHGQPEERFYNLMCLAFGADPVTFADLTQDGYLPPNRSPSCRFEYDTLAYATAALGTPDAMIEWRCFDLEAQLYGGVLAPHRGRILVPQGPGLGIDPDPNVIRDSLGGR
jgi:hypothetical protein